MYSKLNLGCGTRNFPNCLNVDIRKTPITHEIHDLNKFPYPWPDNRFQFVYAYDIIEHLDNVIKVLEEIHRILKPNGMIFVSTTYYKSENAFTDPTHKHYFTLHSFDYFDPSTDIGKKYSYYTDKKFKILHRAIQGQELYFELQKCSVVVPPTT